MFCPQCGTESSAGQPYCRSCGANLKVIGKAVSLSEAVARSDRGPLPQLKEMVKKLKVEGVSDEVSRAFEQVNTEIARHAGELKDKQVKRLRRRQKTPAERRERLRVRGITSMFSGTGLTLFLYFLSHATNLHLPADVVSQIPFDIDPVVRVVWIVGLIPVLAGIGRLLASLTIKDVPIEPEAEVVEGTEPAQLNADTAPHLYDPPATITDRTTNLLDHVKNRAQ